MSTASWVDMLIRPRQDSQAHLDTVLTLPRETDAVAIAAACREAGLAFLNESEFWGKAELVTWLLGPYAQVTQYLSPDSAPEEAAPLPRMREIDAATVEELMRRTRVEVRDALERLHEADGATSFAFSMLATGYVVRCEDTRDLVGWVPTREARRLADRVLSLFAADYLTRPGDYDLDLSICNLCRATEFNTASRHRGTCERHGPHGSGVWENGKLLSSYPTSVRMADSRATLPYLYEVAA